METDQQAQRGLQGYSGSTLVNPHRINSRKSRCRYSQSLAEPITGIEATGPASLHIETSGHVPPKKAPVQVKGEHRRRIHKAGRKDTGAHLRTGRAGEQADLLPSVPPMQSDPLTQTGEIQWPGGKQLTRGETLGTGRDNAITALEGRFRFEAFR